MRTDRLALYPIMTLWTPTGHTIGGRIGLKGQVGGFLGS